MNIKIFIGVIILSLCACATYQPGDVTKKAMGGAVKVLTIQAQYCAESDPIARALLLKIIRSTVPLYPKDGLCTDVLNAVSE